MRDRARRRDMVVSRGPLVRRAAGSARLLLGRAGGREVGENRAEIVRVDRLHEVRVEAGGLGALAIERLTVAADRDQSELGAARQCPQSAGDLEAVDPGKSQIADCGC